MRTKFCGVFFLCGRVVTSVNSSIVSINQIFSSNYVLYQCKIYRKQLRYYFVVIFNKAYIMLLPCCHQADIRMRSHRLLQLDDNKSAASCQQAHACCLSRPFIPKLMKVSTTYSMSVHLKLHQFTFLRADLVQVNK